MHLIIAWPNSLCSFSSVRECAWRIWTLYVISFKSLWIIECIYLLQILICSHSLLVDLQSEYSNRFLTSWTRAGVFPVKFGKKIVFAIIKYTFNSSKFFYYTCDNTVIRNFLPIYLQCNYFRKRIYNIVAKQNSTIFILSSSENW